MKFFIEHPTNILLLLTAITSGAFLLFPALMRRGGADAVGTLQATQLMNSKNAQVLDVRSAEEYARGHLLNARNFPQAMLAQAALPGNKATPLLVVCQNGRQAASAAKTLRTQGFTNVHTLAGGLNAWAAANLPLHK